MDRLLFVTGPGKASIENHFDLNAELTQALRETGKEDLLEELAYERAHAQFFYTRQRQLRGLGHAVLCARSFVGPNPFVVALGDSIIGLHASSDVVHRMVAAFERTGAGAVVAFEDVPRTEVSHYGIARPGPAADGLFRVEDLIEKPNAADAPSTLAIAARYVLSPEIFDALDRTPAGKGGEIQLTDGIRLLIERRRPVYGIRLTAAERRFDIGNIDAYFRAFVEFALADAKHGPPLRTFVRGLLDADHP